MLENFCADVLKHNMLVEYGAQTSFLSVTVGLREELL